MQMEGLLMVMVSPLLYDVSDHLTTDQSESTILS